MDPITKRRANEIVLSIRRIKEEIKRISAHLKKLRQSRKEHEMRLYHIMTLTQTEKYGGIRRASIAPKIPITPQEKNEKMLSYLGALGVHDTHQTLNDIKKLQSIAYLRKLKQEELKPAHGPPSSHLTESNHVRGQSRATACDVYPRKTITWAEMMKD